MDRLSFTLDYCKYLAIQQSKDLNKSLAKYFLKRKKK